MQKNPMKLFLWLIWSLQKVSLVANFIDTKIVI